MAGDQGDDLEILDAALCREAVAMAPVVLAELLSDPSLPQDTEMNLLSIKLLEPVAGFWQRAGKLRAAMRMRGYRPKLADTLIAQTCIDHRVPLLTRDRDFRAFGKHAGLVLV